MIWTEYEDADIKLYIEKFDGNDYLHYDIKGGDKTKMSKRVFLKSLGALDNIILKSRPFIFSYAVDKKREKMLEFFGFTKVPDAYVTTSRAGKRKHPMYIKVKEV